MQWHFLKAGDLGEVGEVRIMRLSICARHTAGKGCGEDLVKAQDAEGR